MTSDPAVVLKGTFIGNAGDNRILWVSNRGFSDLAAVSVGADGRTFDWITTAAIPLRPGINHVELKALGQLDAATFVNIFYSPRETPPTHPLRTAVLHGHRITYEEKGERAIYQGDIVLGDIADVSAGRFRGRLAVDYSRRGLHTESATITPDYSSSTGLWPIVSGVARVPYTSTGVNAANISTAIANSNSQLAGILQWVPATGSDVNYVNFDFDPNDHSGACESSVGMTGGLQPIGGSINCGIPTVMHEMGHAIGLDHEQSRIDRDSYLKYHEENIDKPLHLNMDIYSIGVDSGLFDYGSIMEYYSLAFSRDGLSPTLETIPAGMPLGTTLPQYSAGDRDGIQRLYRHAPSSVTVDTNPSGLAVLVDGMLYTAPHVFNWDIGSSHTLSVPTDINNQTLQSMSGQNYVFGRWNCDINGTATPTVTIVNAAGDGTLMYPSSSPAYTAYLASFIPIHVYNPTAPGGTGTVSALPSPGTIIISGVTKNYYIDREQVTITAHPNSGWSFYGWRDPKLLVFDSYANPDTIAIPSDFQEQAVFVSDPVTAVKSASSDVGQLGMFPSFAVGVVDGNGIAGTYYTPRNFDTSFDGSGFAGGNHLILCASGLIGTTCPATAVAQVPVTFNINYLFSNWSSGATTNSLNVTVPGSGQAVYTANYSGNFRSIVGPSIGCADNSNNNQLTVTANPPGTNSIGTQGTVDAFFGVGIPVNFTALATPASGMSFVGWSQDFNGIVNPFGVLVGNEAIGTANFNVNGTSAPLTITSIANTPLTATSSAVDLTINGTGFTNFATSTFLVQGSSLPSRPFAFVNSNQLTVHLNAGDISTAGYYQIAIYNSSASCSVSVYASFPVAAALQSIAVTPANPVIGNGATQQFTATGTFTDTSTQDLTAQVTWASGMATTATINAAGLATAKANGTSTIGATLGGISGSTVLTVVASKCDINADGSTNVTDVQRAVNEALGVLAATHDLNGDGKVNVIDVQIVISAALSLVCTAI